MQKVVILILAVAVLLTAAFFLFFYEAEVEDEDEEPHFTGKIYDVIGDRILVAEGLRNHEYTGDIEELEGEAIWLTISEETSLLDEDGEETLDLESLKVGDSVEIWTVGGILETYPLQGSASRIGLVEDLEDEERPERTECYVAGCSGELCTANPDVTSTCEFLPGMECLHEDMSCQLVDGECTWVLSESSAQCFLDVLEENEGAKNTRIGYLFEKAEVFFE